MGRDSNKSRIIDKAWAEIFDRYNVLDKIHKNGSFSITSTQINEYKEARLMTKFDYSDNLPDLFYDNKLSILPVTRGKYLIGEFKAYQKFPKSNNVENVKIQFPSWIETIDYNNLYSEAAVINCAYATGIIQDVIKDAIVRPTVSGRMSTSSFNFDIKSSVNNTYSQINVNNSQCEIDGGYESLDKLMLIEAKNSLSKDFLIRQLYYPWRLWSEKVSKKVVPVFLTYSNDVFSFYIYEFTTPQDYNSLSLVRQKNYIIDEVDINLLEIKGVLNKAKIVTEPNIPFPQANRVERIIDLLGTLVENNMTIEDITTQYAFDVRQAQYYSRAGMYLGLIESKEKGVVGLTKLGIKVMSMRSKQKYLSIAECILKHKVFNEVMKFYFERLSPPTIEDTYQIMLNNTINGVNSDSTRRRRAQGVNQWVNWILGLQNS
jgi:predicted transcriptional regulator